MDWMNGRLLKHSHKKTGLSRANFKMAERVGFEPTVHLSAYTHLAGEHLQPLGHLSAVCGGGSRIRTHGAREGTTAFKAAALNHSAIPP